MANYPNSIYSPRTKANKDGVVYDPTKQTVGYAEDVNYLDDEVVAVETLLGTNEDLQVQPIAGAVLKGKASGKSKWSTEIFIDPSGNVGIGEVAPGAKLSVSGGMAVGSSYDTTSVSDGNLIISGNVGIGTTEPTRELEIPKTEVGDDVEIRLRNNDNTNAASGVRMILSTGGANAGDPKIYFANDVNEWYIGLDNSDNDKLKISYNAPLGSGDKLTIDSSGNVGIGTTSPNNLLSLFKSTTPALGFTTGSGDSAWTMGIDTSDANKFKIASSTAVGTNARLTIDGNGNVGIGTTAPSSPNSRTPVLHIKSGAFTNLPGLVFESGHSTYSDTWEMLLSGDTDKGSGAIFSIADGTSVRLAVDADGNVGIGSALTLPSFTGAGIFVKSDGNVGIGTTGPTALLDINSDILRLRTAKTPATSGAAGNAGNICWDSDYIYICVATNTWKRVAIASW